MKKIILITGMSGAGKTTAMQILDDMGYHCIDRFPVELLSNLYQLIDSDEENYKYVCLTATAIEYPIFLNFFNSKKMEVQTIFLDCSDEQLIVRYKFTRRQHPFILSELSATLKEAIQKERDLFKVFDRKDMVYIDTTIITKYDLKRTLEYHTSIDCHNNFKISFVSFGYKNGIPQDADLVFDVRFLPNPYYNGELKTLTGDDEKVYQYVLDQSDSKMTIQLLQTMFDQLFPKYANDGRTHLTIAIGCTGGKHRSVTFVNYFYNQYHQMYCCLKKHRDIGR